MPASTAFNSDSPVQIDVLGLGCAAVDDLIFVEEFPLPDAKTRVLRRERHCGGLTTTALVAASRLGANCAYAGVLGDDELSCFVLETLHRENVDVSHAPFSDSATPLHATIVVATKTGTRNILLEKTGRTGSDDELPDADVIRRARVLFIDQFNEKGNLRAARLAREAQVPVVADFEATRGETFSELLGLVDHLVVSHSFASDYTQKTAPQEILDVLHSPHRAATLVTTGAQGCWYRQDDSEARHFPAFVVPVVDTTGCGDAFHGAYAAALAWGMSLEERVRLACAVAALKAMQPGGQQGLPRRDEVEQFLAEQDKSASDAGT